MVTPISLHMPNLRVIPQRFFNAAVLWAPRHLRGVIQRPCSRKPPLFIFLQLPYTLDRCTTHASCSIEQQRPPTAVPLEVVLTNPTTGHILYTKHLFSQPDGRVVLCPSRCNTELHFKEKDKHHVRFDCNRCGAYCTLTSVKANLSTLLGSWRLVKTPFPQPVYKGAVWKYGKAS